MSMPKGDEATREFFRSLLPEDDRVTVRPMFGNLAGFVHGNMFTGILGSSVFVRLPERDREELLALPGASIFAPMPERPMKGYVVMPAAWRDDPDQARTWVVRSLEWAASLPPKEAKKRGK